MSSIIRSLIVLIGFSFRGRFVCLDEMDTERSMRQVLNFKNKKAVPQHCSNSYRESGLVQQEVVRELHESKIFGSCCASFSMYSICRSGNFNSPF